MDDLGRNPAVTDTVILGNVPPSTASYRGCWLEREEQKRRVNAKCNQILKVRSCRAVQM